MVVDVAVMEDVLEEDSFDCLHNTSEPIFVDKVGVFVWLLLVFSVVLLLFLSLLRDVTSLALSTRPVTFV